MPASVPTRKQVLTLYLILLKLGQKRRGHIDLSGRFCFGGLLAEANQAITHIFSLHLASFGDPAAGEQTNRKQSAIAPRHQTLAEQSHQIVVGEYFGLPMPVDFSQLFNVT